MKFESKIIWSAITINLMIAIFILRFMLGNFTSLLDLVLDWPINLATGIIACYLSVFFIRRKLTLLLIKKKGNSIFVGILALLTILLTGVFFGSTVGFIQEGLDNTYQKNWLLDAIFDYYVKPLFWIMFFGTIPTLFIGGLMGYIIRKWALTQNNINA